MSVNTFSSNPTILQEVLQNITASRIVETRNYQLEDTSSFPLQSIGIVAFPLSGLTVGKNLYVSVSFIFFSQNDQDITFTNGNETINGHISGVNIPQYATVNFNAVPITSETQNIDIYVNTVNNSQTLYTLSTCYASVIFTEQ